MNAKRGAVGVLVLWLLTLLGFERMDWFLYVVIGLFFAGLSFFVFAAVADESD